jgi:hypothetical protein
MSTFITAKASSELVEDGEIVEKAGMKMRYDGETMDLAGFSNEGVFYAQLDQDDIMQLLATRADTASLESRLKKAYGSSIKKKTRSRRPRRPRSRKRPSSRRTRRSKSRTE